jgi:two-component system nitrogen regulation response regulator NtrX
MSQERIKQELFVEPEKQDVSGVFIKRNSVLEAANNGTLYIDEVGDLPINVQQQLLKFLQDQIFEHPATRKVMKLDVRIISATSKNLQSEISAGKFRQDLYYRLNVVPMKIPTLSERKEDIPLLINFFVKQLAKFSGLKERTFSEDAIAALQAYNWPGNIRQLRNVIEWTLIMNPTSEGSNIIRSEMLPPEILNSGVTIYKPEANLDMMSMPLREAREVFERQYLSAQMSRFNNNISKTSAFVGMERSALHRKLKLLNIHTGGRRLDELEDSEMVDYA